MTPTMNRNEYSKYSYLRADVYGLLQISQKGGDTSQPKTLHMHPLNFSVGAVVLKQQHVQLSPIVPQHHPTTVHLYKAGERLSLLRNKALNWDTGRVVVADEGTPHNKDTL